MGKEYDAHPLRRKVREISQRNSDGDYFFLAREDTLARWCATEVDAAGFMVPVSFSKHA